MEAPRTVARELAARQPDVAGELASLRASVEALTATVGVLSARLAARDDDTLTAADVCEVLHIGRTKLHELVSSGALPMWKLAGELRITRGGLSAYIRRCAAAGDQRREGAGGSRRVQR